MGRNNDEGRIAATEKMPLGNGKHDAGGCRCIRLKRDFVQTMAQRRPSSTATVLRPAIVVMGVSGSGKSTLGSLLAKNLGCPFIEGDELHDSSSVDKMRRGVPLTDLDRWPWLDRLGKAIRRSVEESGVAVAACSALKLRYRQRLAAAIDAPVSFIMLETDRDELLRRLARRKGHYMPPSLLSSQLDTLERPDETECALILDSGRSPEELCRASRDWLRA